MVCQNNKCKTSDKNLPFIVLLMQDAQKSYGEQNEKKENWAKDGR